MDGEIMERKEIMELMENVFTSAEAAEYLNISMQRLHQLVQDKQLIPIKTSKSVTLFYKEDLDNRKVTNFSNKSQDIVTKRYFDIDVPFVRDAILYFTIQQYFNNNDKKTSKFVEQIIEFNDFDYRAGLTNNIPKLAALLKTTDKEFYTMYTKVKSSFQQLDEDVLLVRLGDPNYPKLLANTLDAPPYLFLKGDIHLLEEKSVCVVGSRNASNEGMKNTERLVQSLIKRNIVVNAGLAKGIDTATHSTALKYGGKTIAVIGTPINQYYPKENKKLQMEIEEKGLVISQYPPCNSINRWNFPTRNATMSGISLATIIMEAGETSGALKQADYALKQGRDVLIPNSAIENPLIRWPKNYVNKGAKSFGTLKDALMILSKNKVLSKVLENIIVEEVINVEMD